MRLPARWIHGAWVGETALRGGEEREEREGEVLIKQSSRGLRMEYSATRRRAIIVDARWGAARSATEEAE
jgi:hypothetical protein